jgi:hypothetical protein
LTQIYKQVASTGAFNLPRCSSRRHWQRIITASGESLRASAVAQPSWLWGQRASCPLLEAGGFLRRFLRCRARRRRGRRSGALLWRDARSEIGRFCRCRRRNIRTPTRCRRSARRTGGWSWRGSWGRGRHCHQFTTQTTVAGTSLCVKNSQNKGQNEKNSGQPAGKFGQHVGCLRTENILRDPPTKGRAKTLAFRPLHQND